MSNFLPDSHLSADVAVGKPGFHTKVTEDHCGWNAKAEQREAESYPVFLITP
jgi:hypothetical protein